MSFAVKALVPVLYIYIYSVVRMIVSVCWSTELPVRLEVTMDFLGSVPWCAQQSLALGHRVHRANLQCDSSLFSFFFLAQFLFLFFSWRILLPGNEILTLSSFDSFHFLFFIYRKCFLLSNLLSSP